MGGFVPPQDPAPSRPIGKGTRRRGRAARPVVVALSVVGHLAAFQLMLWAQPKPETLVEPPVVRVAMVELPPKPKVIPPPKPVEVPIPKPAPPAKAEARKEPAPRAPAPAPKPSVRVTKAPVARPVLAAAQTPAREPFLELGEGDARGAGGSGSGDGGGSGAGSGGGGECDMRRRLQAALTKDSRVKAAVASALGQRATTGRGMVVWNGDWVTSQGEEGKGLAAVRQAITWEVGFAPKACREQAVRGYVVVALNEHTKIALGSGAWRWSDLLGLRR